MNRRRITLLATIVFLGGHAVYAQPNIQIEWQRTIGGANADNMQSLMQTPDGGYILAGQSNSTISGEKADTNRGTVNTGIMATPDYWLVKTNDTGGIDWQKTIGGADLDNLTSVALTTDGGYFLGGSSKSGISGEKTDTCRGATDYWLLKLDNTGTIEWQKTYGSTDNGPQVAAFTGYDDLQKVIQTSDGGYMAGGFTAGGISGDKTDSNRSGAESVNNDYWVIKMDASGDIEWQKTVGGADDDRLYDLIQTADGGYLLGGDSWSNISGEKSENAKGADDYWIVKLDSTGNLEWDKTIGGDESDILWSVNQIPDGSYILGGQSWSGISGDKADTCRGESDYWVVKIDATGTPEWNKSYGGNDYDWCTTVIPTSEGGYLAHGNSSSAQSGDKTEMGWGSKDYWVIKLDSIGGIEWQKALGGIDLDQTFHSGLAIETNDGKYVVGGYSFSGLNGNKTDTSRGGFGDYWLVKLFEDCPTDTTQITGTVCATEGYLLPWDSTVFAGGVYSYAFASSVKGSRCDSMVVVTLTGMVDTSVSVMDSTLTAQDAAATYQWIDCGTGEPIAGATSAEYTAPANEGSYAVIVTANGCTDTSSCYTLGGTGIADPEFNKQFSVYPNPAKTQVSIVSTSGLQIESIRMFNVLGVAVYRAAGNGRSEQVLDIRQLANGMYLLHMETDKGVAIRKLDIIR